MKPGSTHYQRWHDKDPEVARAFAGMEHLDVEYQRVFGQVMIKISEGLRRRNNNERSSLIEMGAEKIVGLNKSQFKRRWYDQDKIVHKAINSLYVLEENERPLVAVRINGGLDCVREYIEFCQRNDISQRLDDVAKIIVVAVQHGKEAGLEYMRDQSFWDDLSNNPEAVLAINESRLENLAELEATPGVQIVPRSKPPKPGKNPNVIDVLPVYISDENEGMRVQGPSDDVAQVTIATESTVPVSVSVARPRPRPPVPEGDNPILE